MGAHFHLPLRHLDWSSIAESLAAASIRVFVSDAEFERLLEDGQLLEWAEYSGRRYGTPRGPVIAELEQQMFRHAELLEFEEAARVRDEIQRLREAVLRQPEVRVLAD